MIKFLRKYFLWELIFFYLVLKLPILLYQLVPFTFDHGKDSLAIIDMLVNLSPKLIGPWTSIPGFYFGPGWYYLLAPFYLLFDFHPLSGSIAIIVIGLCQLILVYKYFGKLAGLIVTTTPLWIMTTSSAWNPYPLTLVSWLILLILTKLTKNQDKLPHWLCLGLVISFGFHFSTAFAVLYPVLILFSFYLRKIKLSWRKFLFFLLGFFIPFLPQLAFEVRHQFVQTQSVVKYLRGEVDIETQAKSSFWQVATNSVYEIKSAVISGITSSKIEGYFSLTIMGLLLIYVLKQSIKNRALSDVKMSIFEFLIWFLLITAWLWLTHFNTWYLLGIMPLAVVAITKVINVIHPSIKYIYVFWLLITSLLGFYYKWQEKDKFLADRAFLPVKIKAIQTIYQKASGQPFASYHYVRHIYDFEYQYLYFWQAKMGKTLPNEFAYEPKAIPYITQKPQLLEHFANQQSMSKAKIIFYIVEKPLVQAYLDEWWGRQKYGKILETIQISPELTIYLASVAD